MLPQQPMEYCGAITSDWTPFEPSAAKLEKPVLNGEMVLLFLFDESGVLAHAPAGNRTADAGINIKDC